MPRCGWPSEWSTPADQQIALIVDDLAPIDLLGEPLHAHVPAHAAHDLLGLGRTETRSGAPIALDQDDDPAGAKEFDPPGERCLGVRQGPEHVPAQHHVVGRSEEHTSELQSLMRISYAVFCL